MSKAPRNQEAASEQPELVDETTHASDNSSWTSRMRGRKADGRAVTASVDFISQMEASCPMAQMEAGEYHALPKTLLPKPAHFVAGQRHGSPSKCRRGPRARDTQTRRASSRSTPAAASQEATGAGTRAAMKPHDCKSGEAAECTASTSSPGLAPTGDVNDTETDQGSDSDEEFGGFEPGEDVAQGMPLGYPNGKPRLPEYKDGVIYKGTHVVLRGQAAKEYLFRIRHVLKYPVGNVLWRLHGLKDPNRFKLDKETRRKIEGEVAKLRALSDEVLRLEDLTVVITLLDWEHMNSLALTTEDARSFFTPDKLTEEHDYYVARGSTVVIQEYAGKHILLGIFIQNESVTNVAQGHKDIMEIVEKHITPQKTSRSRGNKDSGTLRMFGCRWEPGTRLAYYVHKKNMRDAKSMADLYLALRPLAIGISHLEQVLVPQGAGARACFAEAVLPESAANSLLFQDMSVLLKLCTAFAMGLSLGYWSAPHLDHSAINVLEFILFFGKVTPPNWCFAITGARVLFMLDKPTIVAVPGNIQHGTPYLPDQDPAKHTGVGVVIISKGRVATQGTQSDLTKLAEKTQQEAEATRPPADTSRMAALNVTRTDKEQSQRVDAAMVRSGAVCAPTHPACAAGGLDQEPPFSAMSVGEAPSSQASPSSARGLPPACNASEVAAEVSEAEGFSQVTTSVEQDSSGTAAVNNAVGSSSAGVAAGSAGAGTRRSARLQGVVLHDEPPTAGYKRRWKSRNEEDSEGGECV